MIPEIVKLAPYDPFAWQHIPMRDKSPILLLVGGSGGGKSRLAAEKVHAYLLHYPNSTGLMVRKTRESANESCVPTIWKVMGGEESGVDWHKDTNTFFYPNGSTLYTRGMKDELQRESMRSIGGDGGTDIIWAEEANKLTEQDFNEMLARNRHTAASWQQIILTTNPDSPGHWINQRLILGKQASVYNSVASDNPTLPKSYLNNLNNLTGVQYQRLVENKWVQSEGVVYDNFAYNENVTEDAEYNPDWPVVWGVDDGYARGEGKGTLSYHPRAFVLMQFTPQGGANVFAEYAACLEVEELSLKNVLEMDYPRPEIAYVDSSAAQLKARIWSLGIQTVGATHQVTEGIKNVRRLICDGNGVRLLKIHPRCVELINELQSYAYGDSMTSNNGERKPAKLNDHLCFVAGTLIETDRGSVPIEDLKAGDYVLTRRGYQEIRACGVTQIAGVITVTLNDSYVLTGTHDHPVYTENRGFVRLDGLGIDDIILVSNSINEESQCPRELYQKSRLLSTTELPSAATQNQKTGLTAIISGQTVSIFAMALKHFTAKFGRPRMGLFQRVMIFITKMATQATMTSQTLSAFSSLTTCVGMGQTCQMNGVSNRGVTLRRFAISPKNGTQAMKVANGTDSTRSMRDLENSHLLNVSVSSVGKCIQQESQLDSDSVLTLANPPIVGHRALTMKPVSVPSVGQISRATNMQTCAIAPVRVVNINVLSRSTPQIVYNLTVDAVPEYFANGVLVHNCDAARYALHRLRYE